jgi:hypothetical protein
MKTKNGNRIIAFFLVAGGLLGILNTVSMGLHFARQQDSLRAISAILSAGLFTWSILTGIALWRAAPRGFKWAKMLFMLQVPVFGIARLTYEFSTFFSFRVMIGDTSHYIGGNVGSSSNIYLSPQSHGFIFGINIVAVIALLYLTRESQRPSNAYGIVRCA